MLLLLALVCDVFVVRELRLLLDALPIRILLVLVALRFGDKLVVANQIVVVGVRPTENLLAHAFHLLRPFDHVVVGVVRIVGLVQFLLEQRIDLVLVPVAVAVKVCVGTA